MSSDQISLPTNVDSTSDQSNEPNQIESNLKYDIAY